MYTSESGKETEKAENSLLPAKRLLPACLCCFCLCGEGDAANARAGARQVGKTHIQ